VGTIDEEKLTENPKSTHNEAAKKTTSMPNPLHKKTELVIHRVNKHHQTLYTAATETTRQVMETKYSRRITHQEEHQPKSPRCDAAEAEAPITVAAVIHHRTLERR